MRDAYREVAGGGVPMPVPPVGRNGALTSNIKAGPRIGVTCEVTPFGRPPGEPSLRPGPSPSEKAWGVCTPDMTPQALGRDAAWLRGKESSYSRKREV